MNYFNLVREARDAGDDVNGVIENEITYLKEEIKTWKVHFDKAKDSLNAIFCQKQIDKSHESIDYLNRLKKTDDNGEKITASMISQAKMFPVEALVDFSSGKGMAFCHEDKTPSLSKHPNHNYCRCFVCNKSFDSIAIRMERDGMDFHTAVRSLL